MELEHLIAMSDSIELRCGHKGRITVQWIFYFTGKKHQMSPVAECEQCKAVWLWGRP